MALWVPSPPHTHTPPLPQLFLPFQIGTKAGWFHALRLVMALCKTPLPWKGHSNVWNRVKCFFLKKGGTSIGFYNATQTAVSSFLSTLTAIKDRWHFGSIDVEQRFLVTKWSLLVWHRKCPYNIFLFHLFFFPALACGCCWMVLQMAWL